jgi:hypothetical protein
LKEYNLISKKEATIIISYLKELTPSGIELEFLSISSFEFLPSSIIKDSL